MASSCCLRDGSPKDLNVQFSTFNNNKRTLDAEEQCATIAAVLLSRKTLTKKRKLSPPPAGALNLPNNPQGELETSSFPFYGAFWIFALQARNLGEKDNSAQGECSEDEHDDYSDDDGHYSNPDRAKPSRLEIVFYKQ